MRRFTSGKRKHITAIDGVKVHYEIDEGLRNTSLVFIHGLGGDLTIWDQERLFLKN